MNFDKKIPPCSNCHQPMSDNHVYGFQGVRICGNCAKMVQRALDKMQRQFSFMAQMYNEVLRVALIKGELRFPELPDVTPKEKLRGVTKKQLLDEMNKMLSLGGPDDNRELRPEMEGRPEGHARTVHPLRSDPSSGE